MMHFILIVFFALTKVHERFPTLKSSGRRLSEKPQVGPYKPVLLLRLNFTVSVLLLGRDKGFAVKYSSLPEGTP